MALVIDSSIAISWVLADEDSDIARMALATGSQQGMIVPRIFWYEFRNTLMVNERRGRLQVGECDKALAVLEAINPQFVDGHREGELFRLSRTHSLSVYDAAYVELALRDKAGLATLDRKMRMAAAAEGISVLQ